MNKRVQRLTCVFFCLWQWDQPANYVPPEERPVEATDWVRYPYEDSFYYHSPSLDKTVWEEPPGYEGKVACSLEDASDWVEVPHEDTVYYYSPSLDQAVWEKPASFMPVSALEEEVGIPNVTDWEELTTPEGDVYYYSASTEVSTWEKPSGFDENKNSANDEDEPPPPPPPAPNGSSDKKRASEVSFEIAVPDSLNGDKDSRLGQCVYQSDCTLKMVTLQRKRVLGRSETRAKRARSQKTTGRTRAVSKHDTGGEGRIFEARLLCPWFVGIEMMYCFSQEKGRSSAA